MRTITDTAGTTWTVTEAYQLTGERNGSSNKGRPVTLAVLWFENDSGRTASAHLPAGTLDSVSDDELREFLRLAVARHGQQPSTGSGER